MTPHTAGRLMVRAWIGGPIELTAHRNAPGLRDVVATVAALPDQATAEANAARLVAAWNALDGLTLEQIERLGAALHDEGVITDTIRRVLETAPPLPREAPCS